MANSLSVHYSMFEHASFFLTLGLDTKAYDQGLEYSPYVEANLLFGQKTSCGVRATKPMGDIMNYQLYNLPNVRSGDMDIMYTVGCSRKF